MGCHFRVTTFLETWKLGNFWKFDIRQGNLRELTNSQEELSTADFGFGLHPCYWL